MNLEQRLKLSLNKKTNKKELKEETKRIKQRIKEIEEEKKRQTKEIFDISNKRELFNLKEEIKSKENELNEKITIRFPNKTLTVKESYLKKLKEPEKYIRGLYGRELRREQLKAEKEGNYRSVYGLSKALNRIGQKQNKRVSKESIDFGKIKNKGAFNLFKKGIINKEDLKNIAKEEERKEKEKEEREGNKEESPQKEIITNKGKEIKVFFA